MYTTKVNGYFGILVNQDFSEKPKLFGESKSIFFCFVKKHLQINTCLTLN